MCGLAVESYSLLPFTLLTVTPGCSMLASTWTSDARLPEGPLTDLKDFVQLMVILV